MTLMIEHRVPINDTRWGFWLNQDELLVSVSLLIHSFILLFQPQEAECINSDSWFLGSSARNYYVITMITDCKSMIICSKKRRIAWHSGSGNLAEQKNVERDWWRCKRSGLSRQKERPGWKGEEGGGRGVKSQGSPSPLFIGIKISVRNRNCPVEGQNLFSMTEWKNEMIKMHHRQEHEQTSRSSSWARGAKDWTIFLPQLCWASTQSRPLLLIAVGAVGRMDHRVMKAPRVRTTAASANIARTMERLDRLWPTLSFRPPLFIHAFYSSALLSP